jgi:hypothetical protein
MKSVEELSKSLNFSVMTRQVSHVGAAHSEAGEVRKIEPADDTELDFWSQREEGDHNGRGRVLLADQIY